MRIFFFLIALLACGWAATFAQDISNKSYPYEPATDTTLSTPKGEVIKFTWNHSTLYPGTSRTCQVYIPKEYKPEKPACLFVLYGWRAF
jgi:gluconolactonase